MDGSSFSDAAMPFAAELAEELSLEVSLVRVISTGGPLTWTLAEVGYVELIPEVLTAAVEHLSITTAS
ncbi:MAG: hypothetical protein QGH54_04140 [SAR202 cluster bacterium]|nr:hypothetical protein [SAR202 cluster bacterium]